MAAMGLRRPEKALTAQFVRSVDKPGKHFDGHGLYLRVEINGSRYWVQRIIVRGKRCELGLGSPSLVSLAEAREVALANRRLARAGGDPLAARRRAKAVLTFEEAAIKAHAELSPTWKNPKDRAAFLSSLKVHVFPRFGSVSVAGVTSADIRQVVLAVRTTAPEVARKLVFRISAVLKWSVAGGMRHDNPAMAQTLALPRVEVLRRHYKSLPYGEVANCIGVVQASGAGMSTKLALEFLILTATRSGEARRARWEEMDFQEKVWNIPAARMKMNRQHRVPLSDRALAILAEARAIGDGSGLVFPGTRTGKPLSDMTLSKLVKELGFDADVHGFRTSLRTWVQEMTSFPGEVAEAALAHVNKDRVEAAYARSELIEKRRLLMESWSIYLGDPQRQVIQARATHG